MQVPPATYHLYRSNTVRECIELCHSTKLARRHTCTCSTHKQTSSRTICPFVFLFHLIISEQTSRIARTAAQKQQVASAAVDALAHALTNGKKFKREREREGLISSLARTLCVCRFVFMFWGLKLSSRTGKLTSGHVGRGLLILGLHHKDIKSTYAPQCSLVPSRTSKRQNAS